MLFYTEQLYILRKNFKMKKVITRFATSPTGTLHIGGVKTALLAYAFAKQNQGQFLLRIEDTDIQRSTQTSINSIFESLKWLNINPDNFDNVVFKSKKTKRYQEIVDYLLKTGYAYRCYLTEDEMINQDNLKKWRPENGKILPSINNDAPYVIRFKTPLTGKISWHDMIKGEITFNNSDLDDFIIMRLNKTFTFHLCEVVNDIDMNITHIIRGEDHVNNTPKHIHLMNALNADIPQFAHVPLILNQNGEKLSKRNKNTVLLKDLKNNGILPAALINYLSSLGYGALDAKIFDMNYFIQCFNIKKLSRKASRFDMKKLESINKKYLQNITTYQENPDFFYLLSNKLFSNGFSNKSWQQYNLNEQNIFINIFNLLNKRARNFNSLVNDMSNFTSFFSPERFTNISENQVKHFLTLLKEQPNFATYNIVKIKDFIHKLINILNLNSNWDISDIQAFIDQFCTTYSVNKSDCCGFLRGAICRTIYTPDIVMILSYWNKNQLKEYLFNLSLKLQS